MLSSGIFEGVAVFDALKTSSRLGASLTGDEVLDNAVVALLILVIANLLRDIIARLVYFQPRFSDSNDSLSYHSQARVCVLDNFSRRVWKMPSFNVVPGKSLRYVERNRKQWLLIIVAAVVLVMFEIIFTVLALPASKLTNSIKLKSTDIIGFHVARHEPESGLLRQPNSECTVSPLFDAPNVKSDVTWSWCHHKTRGGRLNRYITNSTKMEAIRVSLQVNHMNNAIEAFLKEPRPSDGKTLSHSISHKIYVNSYVHGTLIASVQSNTRDLTECFLENAKLTRNKTGLDIRFERYVRIKPEKVKGNVIVNASIAKGRSPVYEYVILLLGGCISMKPSGSRLFQVSHDKHKHGLELKGEIKVAEYVGTMLTPTGAVIFATVVLLVDIMMRVLLRGPPGMGWEVVTAHGRLCTDVPLSGPNEHRFITKSKNGDICYVGFGIPPGFTAVDSFDSGDNVNAKPLAEDDGTNIGTHSLTRKVFNDVDYWEYGPPLKPPSANSSSTR